MRKPPAATPSVAEQKRIVSGFLARCIGYADDRLAEYRAGLDTAQGMEALAIQDKISHWSAYRAFTEYTIEELKTEELDDWFGARD
ncbi:MAG: hypothetical protein IT495_02235 [Gammaproteobacteria bacterium]|nr:hypothetical protein [Gammaproteobacteria bacterium]